MKAPSPRHRSVVLCLVVAVGVFASALAIRPVSAQSAATGGFVETGSTLSVAPVYSPSQIQGFLPSRGRFTFPAPYGTQGVRLTNATDCGGGDCVLSVGYSYWRNINNHVGSDTMLVAIGLNRYAGGTGPTLFSYNKVSGETRNLGGIFDPNSAFSYRTGEGWYFSATLPTVLYVNERSTLFRYDVITRQFSTVFDATTYFGSNRTIWQIHSSNDDRVHSFTLKDGTTYADLGCGVYLENSGQFRFYPAKGDYDECQVDKSGRFVVIKENWDGAQRE